jgi:tRNA-binding EMAP/Myf-like protein
MKASLNWLKRLVDLTETPEEIASHLTAAGLEVEEWHAVNALPGVVIGEVRTCEKVEGTKLSQCVVWDGKQELPVVCGAPNVRAGLKVALATVGTTMPGGLEIKAAKIRGMESQGMLCADDELGLGTSHDGILELDQALVTGSVFSQATGVADVMFEINVTPNRPDATGHLGLARELALRLNRPLKNPLEGVKLPAASGPACTPVSVEAGVGCSRYVGRTIKGVKDGSSPAWMQNLLRTVGLRPISALVDITNFVLLEIGQPLHAFDLAKLRGGQSRGSRCQGRRDDDLAGWTESVAGRGRSGNRRHRGPAVPGRCDGRRRIGRERHHHRHLPGNGPFRTVDGAFLGPSHPMRIGQLVPFRAGCRPVRDPRGVGLRDLADSLHLRRFIRRSAGSVQRRPPRRQVGGEVAQHPCAQLVGHGRACRHGPAAIDRNWLPRNRVRRRIGELGAPRMAPRHFGRGRPGGRGRALGGLRQHPHLVPFVPGGRRAPAGQGEVDAPHPPRLRVARIERDLVAAPSGSSRPGPFAVARNGPARQVGGVGESVVRRDRLYAAFGGGEPAEGRRPQRTPSGTFGAPCSNAAKCSDTICRKHSPITARRELAKPTVWRVW